jgi:hypothetical protein
MCREAHSEGVTRHQIENALKILPIVGSYVCSSKKRLPYLPEAPCYDQSDYKSQGS